MVLTPGRGEGGPKVTGWVIPEGEGPGHRGVAMW